MAVSPVLSDLVSAPNAPNRSGQGGRDRRSKFYEISGNLEERVSQIELAPAARDAAAALGHAWGHDKMIVI
jgi:hypothetical protein